MLAVVSPQVSRSSTGWSAYLAQSRRPLASFVFIGPLVLAYELGVIVLGSAGPQGSADSWLRFALEAVGLGRTLFLPLLTVVLLLAWHHVSRQRWQLSVWVPLGMLAESLTLAALLLVAARLPTWMLEKTSLAWAGDVPLMLGLSSTRATIQAAIDALGAGIYEEVLFRLLMVPGVIVVAKRLGLGSAAAVATAVAVSSALFAAAHFFGASGDVWNVTRFGIRFAAGVFFAIVFLRRGFGIAAGTHTAYDLLVDFS